MQNVILILGKNGQVGWELQRAAGTLGEIVAWDYPDIDFTRLDLLLDRVRALRPRVIVNAAAYTAVDKAESERALAQTVNGEAPGILAREARALGAFFVHYSTDYVFDGTNTAPYVEEDPPQPVNVYGETKLAGERAVAEAGGDFVVLRTSWVYGARGQNFLRTMLRLARQREVLRVVGDQHGAPTWSRMLAEVTAGITQRWLAQPKGFPSGLYHATAAGRTTWHAFAEAIISGWRQKGGGSDLKVNRVDAISTAEYPTPARRPAFSVLNSDKLEHTFGLRMPDWRQSLELVLQEEIRME
jgi:dTDP-4-dehydrorhamnose reductase